MTTVLKDQPVEEFPSTDEEIEYKDDVLKYDSSSSKSYSSRSSSRYDDDE